MKPRWVEIEAELDWLKTEFVDIDEQPAIKKSITLIMCLLLYFLMNKV